MKNIDKLPKSELKAIVQQIINVSQELTKNNVLEDSDMGLYTKSILINHELIDSNLL